jgi:peptidoglycan/LPS O-acetylase OafA/YrhL
MTRAVEARLGEKAGAGRLAGLDLLRLVAAVAVVLFHFGYAGPARGTMATGFPALAGIAKYGFLGVDLFFLISGFVISASAQNRSAGPFAVSRFQRLYPAYLAGMTFTALAIITLGAPGTSVSIWQWLANLTMLAPAFGQQFMDGVYWSIVVEIVFYGWVAILIGTGLFRRHLIAIIAIWLAVAFLNELFVQWRPLRLALMTEYAGLFASGMLIYRLRIGDRSIWSYGLLAIAFAHGLHHTAESRAVFERIYTDDIDSVILWLAHAGIFLAFSTALAVSNRFAPGPLVLTLGGITYPLYLIHQQAGYLAIDALAPLTGNWLALAAVLSGCFMLAWAIHVIAEPAGRLLLQRAIAHAMGRKPTFPASPGHILTLE